MSTHSFIKTNTMKNIVLAGLTLCLAILAAQVATAQPDLPGEKVDVIKSFDARLLDTERVGLQPTLPPLDTTVKRQTYNVITKQLKVEYLPPVIRPLGMKREKVEEGYKGYAKIGAGLPTAFYGEASYDIITKSNFEFGIDLNHFSANNTRKVENQRFSQTSGKVDGTYHFDQGFAVKGQLGYSSNTMHFYGYNDLNEEQSRDFTFDASDVRQRFSLFEIGGNIFNGVRTELDFNYDGGVKFYNLTDNYGARENGFLLDLNANKWFNEKHPLNVRLITDFTNYRAVNEDRVLNNFLLQPNFTYHGERFKVKMGMNIGLVEDEFSIFPDLEASVSVVPGIVNAYVGADGTLQKNSFRTLSEFSPFIASNVPIRNTKYYNYFGGARGNIQGADYDLQIGYKRAQELPLFLLASQTDSFARFDVLYDTVNIFTFKGSVAVPVYSGISLVGSFAQSIYTLNNEERAWHLPAFSVNAGARYTSEDKRLLAKVDFFLENGVPYRDLNDEIKTLNALFDISLGAEYFFSKNVGGFFQLNNLANNRRQRWQRYPTLGLNAMFGVTVRF